MPHLDISLPSRHGEHPSPTSTLDPDGGVGSCVAARDGDGFVVAALLESVCVGAQGARRAAVVITEEADVDGAECGHDSGWAVTSGLVADCRRHDFVAGCRRASPA
jgi:hypothetical protein